MRFRLDGDRVGRTGTGNGTVTYSVAANGTNVRAGRGG
jgi:hypothetical protein